MRYEDRSPMGSPAQPNDSEIASKKTVDVRVMNASLEWTVLPWNGRIGR